MCHPLLPRSACDPPAPVTPLFVPSQIYMPDSLEYQPVACAIVVNAAGAWAGKLLEAEGLPKGLCKPSLPIQPRKRYWGGHSRDSLAAPPLLWASSWGQSQHLLFQGGDTLGAILGGYFSTHHSCVMGEPLSTSILGGVILGPLCL